MSARGSLRSLLALGLAGPIGLAAWSAQATAPDVLVKAASEDVVANVLARADRFTSPRLHRTFSPLYFGTVRAAPSPSPNEKEM